ncbi:MAG: hypothetical protein QM703_29455 [Gemmatales bacterium]
MRFFNLTRLYLWLGVLTLGSLIVSATQAEPMVPPRTTAIHLHNKTDKTLYLTNVSLPHGDWTPKLKPPAEIKPGATGYWKSEAGGVAALSGPKGNVRYSIGNASWHTPFGITPTKVAKAGAGMVSLSHSPDAEDVFYVGEEGSINCVYWTAKANKWSAPYQVAPGGSGMGASPLAGVSRAPGHLDLFWITSKGEIASRAFANSQWGNVFKITGPNVTHRMTDLAVVTSQKDWIDVYWIGKDGAIYSCSWRGKDWYKPTSHTPPNSAVEGSSLTAITRTKDEIHVFYTNKEGAIATVWWRGKWNGPAQITAKSTVTDGSSLSAVALSPSHLAVFWVNREGAVCTNYQVNEKDGGKWHDMFAISPAKAARSRTPLPAYNRTSNHMDVFWLAPDGSVMTTYFQSGGQWNKPFAIASPGAARVDSNMVALSRVNHHVDVFWLDGKGILTTNWWDAKSVEDIYISWTNPLVESQYGNTYHEQAPPNFSLSYTGGTGNHAEVKYVLEKSSKRVVSGFKPSTHGFKFSNGYWKDNGVKLPVVTIDFPKPFGKVDVTNSSQGLCGGMVYAVIDYFLAKQPIPQRTTAPINEADPLFQYLKKRLATSWDVTGTGSNYIKFMRHDYPDADEGVVQGLGLMKGRSYIIAREEWPKIKADIDANRLSPIALMQIISYDPTKIGKNHQVLVYGYQLSGSNVTLHYYDPNYPNNDTVELRFTIGDLSKRIDIMRFIDGKHEAKTINTFFRTTYSPPPASLVKPQG